MKKTYIFSLLVLFYCAQTLTAQPLTLDPTFGQNGITEIPNTSNIHTFEFDKAGNIIAVGYTTMENKSYLTIVKTNAHGVLDPSFGDNGIVYSLEAAVSNQLGLRITHENKIFIVGSCFYPELGNKYKRTFMQFNEDGSVDETFGDHGKIIINYSGTVYISSLNIESDDFLLFGGYESNSLDPFILKRNYDGILDDSFGDSGITYLTDHETYRIIPYAIKTLSDQSILIAGENTIPTGWSDRAEVAFCKISSNGNLVTEFANNGIWKMNVYFDTYSESFEYFADAIEDSKGNLLLLGTFYQINHNVDSSFLCQFHPDGTMNTDFGKDGFCNFYYRDIPNLILPRMFQNGKNYIVGGYNIIHSINLDGTIDKGFNNTGSYSCQGFTFLDMKLQENTKLILGGSANGKFALVRLDIPYNVSVEPYLLDERAIAVYPNPTTGVLNLIQKTINNEQLTINNIEIFDIYGKKHHLITSSSHHQINISHLPAGVYFIKVYTEKGVVVEKVIKN